MTEQQTNTAVKLPQRLVSSVDLSRAIRELKNLDDALTQMAIRQPGQAINLPKTSATLEELATANNVSLLDKTQREQLITVLAAFSAHTPRIHMSFAVEPSATFLESMIVWLRQNINPVILMEVGLQPTLAAGCTVRTTNKLFDLSLRHRFTESRMELVKSIAKVTASVPDVPAHPPAVTQAPASTAPPAKPTVPAPAAAPATAAPVPAAVAQPAPEKVTA